MTNLSPPPFRLGDMEIRRVMEMQFPFLPAGRFLPDATDDALAPLRTAVRAMGAGARDGPSSSSPFRPMS